MIYAFGDFEVDAGLAELRCRGTRVRVEPQVFGVLCLLVERAGRVVAKTELLDEVWGTRLVSDSALTSRVKAARRALGDQGRDPRLIHTVRGQGYRFVAPVEVRAGPHGTSEVESGVGLLERDAALATLVAALGDAAHGRGRVALVAGEPGIGKTALVRALAGRAGGARVLWGGCDDLITPRPFAPLHDLAAACPPVDAALAEGAPAAEVQRRVLAELDRRPFPHVVVLEDVHWADEATLDLVTFLARRIARTHGLLVLTYRDTELGEADALLAVVGSVPAEVLRPVQLASLSLNAVTRIVGTERAEQVMAVSRGNPFYVTELAASGTADLPASVRHAVLARLAHLPAPTRDLLGRVAVVPARLELDLLDALDAGWGEAIDPAERGGLLVVTGEHVQFRHELARRAVLDAVPAARRRQLHRAMADLLVERAADPARIVHHAEAAGDGVALAAWSLRAARQAAGAAAHREALSQYRRALGHLDRLAPREQPVVHEEASREAYLIGDQAEALSAAEAALAGFEHLGDGRGAGRLHRWLSRLHWFGGRRAQALAAGRRAVSVLEPLGPATDLAWAYSNLAQLAMLAYDDGGTRRWGVRAVDLAERVGDEAARSHALVNLAMADLTRHPDKQAPMLAAVAVADGAGEHHEATRGLLNIAFTLMGASRPAGAAVMARRALAYADRHEVHSLAHYIVAMLARIDVLTGRWAGVEERLLAVMDEGLVTRMLALDALALLQVRRGDPPAADTLARAWQHAVEADELQRLVPVAAARAEHGWLAGRLDPGAVGLRACYDEMRRLQPGREGVLARWLQLAGCEVADADRVDEPYRAELAGRWAAAAAAWDDRDMPYDRALCLARVPGRLDEAVALADELGAAPLARRLRRLPAAALR